MFFPADRILKHTYKRIVYLYSLVDDIQSEIMKIELNPCFIVKQDSPKVITKHIGVYWFKRYALKRIQNQEVRSKIPENSFSENGFHSAYVKLPESEYE